jgi:mRNA interferase HicA
MKRRDVEIHLTTHGCRLLREGGSHSVYRNEASGKTSALPRHREIKNALVRKICADLGIPTPFVI